MANYRLFKQCLEVAASSCRVTISQLQRERGVNDFLIEISGEEDLTPQDIAVRALTSLCVGTGILDGVIAIAVVGYLDETIGRPSEDSAAIGQRVKDLCEIVSSNSHTESVCLRWYEAWYT
jgi:hypothetical protein